MDWYAWHKLYDADTALQKRLSLVRKQIAAGLRHAPPGVIRLISVCAGDGRDVIGALVGHPRARDVRARLVELDPELVAAGRAAAELAGLGEQVEFVQGDASSLSAYGGIAPAQVVVMCGMLGLVPATEISGLVQGLRALTAPGGRVVWTRNLDWRDGFRQFKAFRSALAAAAFSGVTCRMTSWSNLFSRSRGPRFAVATHRYRDEPAPLPADYRFFHISEANDIRVPS